MADGIAGTPMAVTVNVVVLTIRDGQLSVLLRPCREAWALPGGPVAPAEDLDGAARRLLAAATGRADPTADAHLEQLRTYGRRAPDPEAAMRSLAVAYLSLLPGPARPDGRPVARPDGHPEGGPDALPDGHPEGGPDARPDARPDGRPECAGGWLAVAALAPGVAGGRYRLAFDQAPMVADGVERARAKLEYSSLATAFCVEPFTLADLRRVYETVWAVPLDVPNFRRKVLSTPGLVRPLGRRATPASGGRPAQLYVRGPAQALHPAMVRP